MLKKPVSRRGLNSVFVFLFLLGSISLAIGDEETDTTAEYSNGAKQCMTCHSEGKDTGGARSISDTDGYQ